MAIAYAAAFIPAMYYVIKDIEKSHVESVMVSCLLSVSIFTSSLVNATKSVAGYYREKGSVEDHGVVLPTELFSLSIDKALRIIELGWFDSASHCIEGVAMAYLIYRCTFLCVAYKIANRGAPTMVGMLINRLTAAQDPQKPW
jgi:hypothetical protein